MTAVAEAVATHVAESLADKAMQELNYLCSYKSYADHFEEEKTSLSARRSKVLKDIEEAKDRNENEIEHEVRLWLDRANEIIQEDTKGKKKWFGLVTNCFWKNKRGKELEGKTQRIKQLMEQSNSFTRVARSTGLPGIEFYSSPNFMQFSDRKLQFGKLTKALKDGNKFMIGLYGLGGTGKTTMALEVGKEVEESKVFDKVIFSVVSKDANLKKIRDNIAKHLNLPLNEGMDEFKQAQELWKRIVEGGEKVLIILDDMWEKLTLRDIGIPLGHHGKGCCAILLTTRDWRVCRDMGCHETIELEVLNEKDAVDLFLCYAGKSIDGSSNDFKDVALGLVKECGRLPVAIVAVARALKSRPLKEWEQALERLRNPESVHDVKEDLKEAYNSLRLSYDHLNEKAKQLFLLCSLFPEDYEIPIEFLTRMAIGLGLCGEAKKYSAARSHFTLIKNELTDSCLLLKVGNDEYVKMHDLVREVALWIGNGQVQVVMDSNTTLMENVKYSSWNIIDFPNHFNCRKLEVLLLWLNNSNAPIRKFPDAIDEGMEKLRILALMNESIYGIPAVFLFQSPLSLTNVRTLAIKKLEIRDLSMLVNLKSLESLELSECSVVEFPNKIRELEKLRLLEIVQCVIERNNLLEGIVSCSQLEELYYVENHTVKSLAQITTLPKLQRYYIKGGEDITISNICGVNFPISGYPNPELLRVNLSNEVFKSLVARAEVLKLGRDYDNRGWTNIVPDILPMKDDNMKDHLTMLSLESVHEKKCLIHTEHLRSGVPIFSKLVELKLFDMHVRELCCGPYPVDFLKQLKMLNLSLCQKLESVLFDGKLDLCNLKSIYLSDCSMTCLFYPSTAQSLKQLETLEINGCYKLKYIVAEAMDDHDSNQKSHNDSIFPKLKHLQLGDCPELEFILPICFCQDLPLLKSMEIFRCAKLKYIFGQYPKETDLHQLGKQAILQLLEEVKICKVPNFINIYAECYVPKPCSDEVHKSSPSKKVEDGSSNLSRGLLCCFWRKSNASTIHHPSASMNTQLDYNQALSFKEKGKPLSNSQELPDSRDIYVGPKHFLIFRNLSMLWFIGCKQLKFILSASTKRSIPELRKLVILDCEELVSIIEDDEENQQNPLDPHQPCFQRLSIIQVKNCKKLKCLFAISTCAKLPRLLLLEIEDAPELVQVFEWKQGAPQEMVIKDVLPNLVGIRLVNLPSLHTIYHGIDFQTVKIRLVRDCKNIPLANVSYSQLSHFLDSYGQEQMNFVDHDNENDAFGIFIDWICELEKELFLKARGRDKTKLEENISTPDLAHNTQTSASEIVGQQPSTSNAVETPSSNSERESKGDQEALGEGISLTEGPQRLEEPTNDLFTKETTNKVALAIPPTTTTTTTTTTTSTTEMTSPLREEVSKKIAEKDSTTHERNNNSPNLTESTTASSANEIVEEKLSTTPSSNSDLNLKATWGEAPSLEKYDQASSPTYSKPKIEKPYKLSPPKDKIMDQPESSTEKQNKFDQGNHQQFEGHDLMRLFQITKEGADMEVGMPYLSKIVADLQDNKELSKAFADLEGSLKMSLNEIASSEESRLRLKNALNILSSHCSEDGAPSHGLHATIHSLQQEMQTILASFNQAYATIDKFTKLEQKENLMIEQRSKREKAAKTLLSDINNTKNFIATAKSCVAEDQLKEAELKEQIYKLQAEMRSKEEEIEECERRLLCLREQEKKIVSDTVGFTMEFLAMEKERSHVGEDQMMKAKQQLQNMDTQWSSCLSTLKETALLLGVHLKQKLSLLDIDIQIS